MLTRLSIRNVVLIDKLDLDLSDGLTVFTGETGAGKSILLDSLSLTLGARADAKLVRHGEKEASVTAQFSLSLSHPIGGILSDHGYSFDGDLIIRRIVTADGRSRAFVNDEPVSISFLKDIGDLLVEIHGQFASHRLLEPATHRETLDNYGDLTDLGDNCRRAYRLWQSKKQQRNEAEQELAQTQAEETFLRESVADLERLNPVPGEEKELSDRRTRLMNSEKVVTALQTAQALISDDNPGCLNLLGEAIGYLERANDWVDHTLDPLVNQISEAMTLIGDTAAELEKTAENWGDISELPAIDDRLFALRDMARKHRVAISELPDLQVRLKQQINQLEIGENTIIQLRDEEEKARKEYLSAAEKISVARQKAAGQLDLAVGKELPALKLNKATFKTEIEKLSEEDWSEAGWDKVAFLVSTNKGMPLSPIHKIASGGELARFMLALKVNLAKSDEMETLVFDEVDSGVGGATADAVGLRLKQLSDGHQVLVVTHSPQVAAYGQNHISVRKQETKKGVVTTVTVLSGDSRRDEIARMLSGAKITSTAQTMATELLNTCS